MKKILFPTDFSATANNAFEYALHMADRLEAEVILYHAFHHTIVDPELIPAGIIENLEKQELAEAILQLQEFEKEIQVRLGKQVPVSHRISYGFPKDGILEIAREVQPDLIIMGTDGANNLLDKILGSITSGVIKNSICPVLAIPKEAVYKDIEKIVYATSFTEESLDIFEGLIAFSKKLDAKLVCVHVKKENQSWDLLELDFFLQLYRKKVDRGDLEFYLHHDNNIFKGLQDFLEDQEADMLAVYTQRKVIFERLISGSITQKMAFHGKTPFLAFHKQDIHHIA